MGSKKRSGFGVWNTDCGLNVGSSRMTLPSSWISEPHVVPHIIPENWTLTVCDCADAAQEFYTDGGLELCSGMRWCSRIKGTPACQSTSVHSKRHQYHLLFQVYNCPYNNRTATTTITMFASTNQNFGEHLGVTVKVFRFLFCSFEFNEIRSISRQKLEVFFSVKMKDQPFSCAVSWYLHFFFHSCSLRHRKPASPHHGLQKVIEDEATGAAQRQSGADWPRSGGLHVPSGCGLGLESPLVGWRCFLYLLRLGRLLLWQCQRYEPHGFGRGALHCVPQSAFSQ